jgi:hypothetical protein
MPNEVIIDHPAQYGGGARALPLFSVQHSFAADDF